MNEQPAPILLRNTDFYTAAAKNRRNSRLLFAVLLLLLGGMGFLIGWLDGADPIAGAVTATIAIVIGAIWMLIAQKQGARIVMKINGARELRADEELQLHNVVQEMAIAAGVAVPKIYIMETESMNAFATGMSPDTASVGITRGLLNRLDRDELQAVIAHEMGHIINFDIRYATNVGVMVGVIVIISDILRRSFFYRGRGSRNKNQGVALVIMLVVSILAAFAAKLIQMAISREREYLADATSVRLTRNPQGLIRALTKLTNQNVPFETASQATQHLFIVNPFKQLSSRSSALMSTHPSLDQRIERLKNLG